MQTVYYNDYFSCPLGLECTLAQHLWDSVFNLFGIHWVMPRTVCDLLMCWPGVLGKNMHAVIWRTIPHCLLWCVWREQNLRTFEGLEMAIPDIQLNFFRMLFDWIHVLGVFSFSSFQDVIDLCSSYSLQT